MTVFLALAALIAILFAAYAADRRDPYALTFWLYVHAVISVGMWLRMAGVIA